MQKELTVVAIHGMGTKRDSFPDDMMYKIRGSLPGTAAESILWRGIDYEAILGPNQLRVWQEYLSTPVCLRCIRKFMVECFSDATSYLSAQDNPDSVYQKIHTEVRSVLRQTAAEAPGKPVVLLAESLGCMVMSDYLWDSGTGQGIWNRAWNYAQDVPSSPEEAAERLTNLRLLVTAGCNIPIFVAGHAAIPTFQRPHPGFVWRNYYSRWDVLGYPLRPLGAFADNNLPDQSYDRMVNEDVRVNSGLPFICHSGYWKNRRLVRDTRAGILALLP